LFLNVFLKDHAYAEYIGAVIIPTNTLIYGDVKEGWFPIVKKNRMTERGSLHIRVEFISQVSANF
jgi:hypothetical protein